MKVEHRTKVAFREDVGIEKEKWTIEITEKIAQRARRAARCIFIVIVDLYAVPFAIAEVVRDHLFLVVQCHEDVSKARRAQALDHDLEQRLTADLEERLGRCLRERR